MIITLTKKIHHLHPPTNCDFFPPLLQNVLLQSSPFATDISVFYFRTKHMKNN